MSHQPNWQEYGVPVGAGSGKTAVEVHDSIYGCYQPLQIPAATPKPSTQLDPKPFGSMK